MNILLTNDDGIHAPGLLALYTALSRDHQVFVAAPELEQSAVGHSITLADPIRVKKINRNGGFFGYALSGAPADCVRLGAGELMKEKPDLVVSGINQGANVGVNILYSGTASAATEAAILGLPGLAVSLDSFKNPDFSLAAETACRLAALIPGLELLPGTALNVNVPALTRDKIKGVRWAGQCLVPSGEEFSRRVDPRGNVYYWRGKEIKPDVTDESTDFYLLSQGFITITPLSYDLTRRSELARLAPTIITI
ncbi:MAG: 5'/3'-nucleotidase SurE [Pseudomonadota bacterium]